MGIFAGLRTGGFHLSFEKHSSNLRNSVCWVPFMHCPSLSLQTVLIVTAEAVVMEDRAATLLEGVGAAGHRARKSQSEGQQWQHIQVRVMYSISLALGRPRGASRIEST